MSQTIINNIIDDLTRASEKRITDFELIRVKSDVFVYRCLYDGAPAVIKYFENEADRRELLNYKILRQHNIPTINVFAAGEATLVLEDITANADWRLATKDDLADPMIAESLARWYFIFHENGAFVPELDSLYFEFSTLTDKNIKMLLNKIPEGYALLTYLLTHYDKFREIIHTPAFTLTYNDFYWTNLAVRKDKTAAMMFDYNLLGKGYRFSDFRNVTWPLSDKAKEAFTDTYNQLFFDKYKHNRTKAEEYERQIDDFAAPLFSLYFALTQHDGIPDWAQDEKEELLNGNLLTKAKALLNAEGKNPYAITFMYGENGNGPDVELRFNWITDNETKTVITCEERETFKSNGFRFSPTARKSHGTCTMIENTTPLVNDMIRPFINTSAYHSHKAKIKLKSNHSYYYSVGDGTNQSTPVLFKTRDENPAAFSFLWFADPQQDKYARSTPYVNWDGFISPVGDGNFQDNLEHALNHAYAPKQAHLYVNGKPDFVICSGDHSEHVYDKDGFDGFFLAAHDMLKSTPYAPAIGNHDLMGAPGHTGSWDSPDPYAKFFKSRFNPPRNGAAHRVLDDVNYFFTYGDALVMVLQGNPWHTAAYALDEQIEWMRNVVTAYGNNRWKIVLLHHGVYTVSYDSIHGYEKLMPFYDEYGIDLVLSGHNHVYARSKPIRNYRPAEKGHGTVHITGGTVSGNCAWGGYVYKPDRQIPNKNGPRMEEAMDFLSLTDRVDELNKSIYHIITVDENGINITALRAHDDTVVKHNAPSQSDTAVEFQTHLTGKIPLSRPR
ncbi:MAG: metallophosphoesterase [Defluviitaleaceae bacterium]|nr:metallophosphoesterase [Defluviitaleaceae bacterium]